MNNSEIYYETKIIGKGFGEKMCIFET